MTAKTESDELTLGAALRSIRKERGWSLADTAKVTGLSISSLSKIENGQRSLTYDKIIQLANSLSVAVARLFTSGDRRSNLPLLAGRRSVHRHNDGFEVSANVYTYRYLAHDIIYKRFSPVVIDIHATSIDDFDRLISHDGEEFVYVLEGEIEIHSEIYAPLHLRCGESVFFDSGVGHAYVRVSDEEARILSVGSDVDAVSEDRFIKFAKADAAKQK